MQPEYNSTPQSQDPNQNPNSSPYPNTPPNPAAGQQPTALAGQPVPSQPVQPQQPSQQFAQQPSPVLQPNPLLQQPGTPSGGSKKTILLVGIGLLVVLLLGLGAFFLMKNSTPSNKVSSTAKQSTKSADNSAKDMSTLTHVAFAAPGDMNEYTSKTAASATQKAYTLNGVDSALRCSIVYGTFTQSELPGADIDAILKAQINSIKGAGATVTGPTAGTALELAGSDGKKYSMPTLEYSSTLGGLTEVDHYSVAILSSGERAVVARACVSRGTVDATAAMSKLDATAKELKLDI